MQPSSAKHQESSSNPKQRSGFEELDILISKAKNLQTFQNSLLKQKNPANNNSNSNNNLNNNTNNNSNTNMNKSRKNTTSSKSAVSESRISLNPAEVSSNINRTKENIKKMSSSNNLDVIQNINCNTNGNNTNNTTTSTTTPNNNNTNNNSYNNGSNDLPVLVPLPMPSFLAPSYSSFPMPSFNSSSNPSVNSSYQYYPNYQQQQQQQQPSHSQPQPSQPQQQYQQINEQSSQPPMSTSSQSPIQLPSNIPLVIPLGPPMESSSMYSFNQQPFYQPTSIPNTPQKAPIVHKQKIKELKLKKQSKQSKSMEASINKITSSNNKLDEKPIDFSFEKSKGTESVLTTVTNETIDSFVSSIDLKEQQMINARLPPPPPPPLPKQQTSAENSKKSDDESTSSNSKKTTSETGSRLKQTTLHITEPIKQQQQPQQSHHYHFQHHHQLDSAATALNTSEIIITDSNYTVPNVVNVLGNSSYQHANNESSKIKHQPMLSSEFKHESFLKQKETALSTSALTKSVLNELNNGQSELSSSSTTKATFNHDSNSNSNSNSTINSNQETKAKTILKNNSAKKLNDLSEMLNSKYGIYKGLVASNPPPTPLLHSQSQIQQQQQQQQQQLQSQQMSRQQPPPPMPQQQTSKPAKASLKASILPNEIEQKTQSLKSSPAEFKTSLHIGKQFNSNEITVHLVDDILEDNKTVVKKLLIHCNRIEPISSRSITLTPGQFNAPTTIDLNLNDGKNYLRKELKREIVLPNECDIDSLESYLENGYLHFKCLLVRQQVNDLKHAQIVSLPRLELKNDQSTVIKRSMLNLAEREAMQHQQHISELVKKKLNSSRSDFINKSILKLNSDELTDPKTDTCLNESLNSEVASAQFQFESSPRQQHKHQQNRSRHQSLPSGSSTKSVRFNMNNRTFQLEDVHNNSNNSNNTNTNNNNNNNHHLPTSDDLIQAAHKKNESSSPSTPPNSCKLIRHNSSSSNGHRHRHRSNSNRSNSKSDANASSHHRRTSSNNSNNLSTRLSNDLINDGFNCITKDGLENIFLTYFFKLPSCSPSDRTQVRIEKNSILKLKIIQEKNFAKKSSRSKKQQSHRHNHSRHGHRHQHGSSSSSLSSSLISSALSSDSDTSLSSEESLSESEGSQVENEKITKIKQDDETTKIVLREFSRRCRLPYKVFKFDETGVTVSFINNDWVRVEIPILEILDTNLMASMTSETNFSIFNKRVRSNTKLDHKTSSGQQTHIFDNNHHTNNHSHHYHHHTKNSSEFKEEKMSSNIKLKLGGAGMYGHTRNFSYLNELNCNHQKNDS